MPKQIISRFIVPALGLSGIGFALYFTTVLANPPAPPPQQLALPVETPFDDTISASGVIEANTRNIEIGAYLSGIVTHVLVTEDQEVMAGDALFKQDDSAAQAELAQRQADLATAEATIRQAQANLAEKQDQLKRAKTLQKGLSVSEERVVQAQLLVDSAQAEVRVATARRDAAKAAVGAVQVTLSRLTVTAPIAGKILQLNVRPGEYINVQGNTPPMIMGHVQPLHVRASIDENDLWRFKENTKAKAALRGNRDAQFDLTFLRIEPLVIPKRSLTGQTAERVDTRVMDVVYAVQPNNLRLFVGQLVDVFIETGE